MCVLCVCVCVCHGCGCICVCDGCVCICVCGWVGVLAHTCVCMYVRTYMNDVYAHIRTYMYLLMDCQ